MEHTIVGLVARIFGSSVLATSRPALTFFVVQISVGVLVRMDADGRYLPSYLLFDLRLLSGFKKIAPQLGAVGDTVKIYRAKTSLVNDSSVRKSVGTERNIKKLMSRQRMSSNDFNDLETNGEVLFRHVITMDDILNAGLTPLQRRVAAANRKRYGQ